MSLLIPTGTVMIYDIIDSNLENFSLANNFHIVGIHIINRINVIAITIDFTFEFLFFEKSI